MTSVPAEARAVTGPVSPRGQLGDSNRPLVSVLVPAKDEAENLPLFMEQAAEAFRAAPGRYEVVVIDDGSVDDGQHGNGCADPHGQRADEPGGRGRSASEASQRQTHRVVHVRLLVSASGLERGDYSCAS